MQPAPLTPLGARTHHAHPAYVPVVSALVGVIVVASYLIIANATGFWPFTRTHTAEPTASASPVSGTHASPLAETEWEGPDWQAYSDDAHGFSFWYPDYYIPSKNTPIGFTPNESGGLLSVKVTDGQFTGTQTVYSGFVTAAKLEQFQLNGHTVYKVAEGDAGCGGTSYFFPLPTSYAELSFGDCEGYAGPAVHGDEDAVVNSFAFAAVPGARPQKPPQAPWSRFSSQYFTLSFLVPPGFVVTDEPNDIKVSSGSYMTYANGSDNAFMHLRRYSSEYTKAAAEASFRNTNTNIGTNILTVDGTTFPYFSGTDNGSLSEGTSRGSAFLVLFNKSSLYGIATVPGNPKGDYVFTSHVILETFKFSK